MARVFSGRGTPALVAGILVMSVAGGGYALASGGTSRVAACVHAKTRALYLSPCQKGDRSLTWSTGLGTAYEAVRASGPTGVLHGTETIPPSPLTTVATLHLPAGSYDIRGITNVNTDGWSSACQLTAGGNKDIGEAQVGSGWDAGVNISTEVLHTFTAAGAVTLACGSEGSGNSDTWSARNTTITAVPVGTVTVKSVSG